MDLSSLVVSAPGKVILHGEHAVVYGKGALATSVDLRCCLILSKTEDREVILQLPDLQHEQKWNLHTLTDMLSQSSESLLIHLRKLSGTACESPPTQNMATLVFLYLLIQICRDKLNEYSGLHATVISTLPASAGLGSSAAFSVCLAAGFLSMVGAIGSQTLMTRDLDKWEETLKGESSCTNEKGIGRHTVISQFVQDKMNDMRSFGDSVTWSTQDLETINRWGLEAEKLIHGTPSGIDNSISTFGGAMRYQSGQIYPLTRVPQVRILLVNSKIPRSTKKMVARVRELYSKYPSVMGPILDSIGAISEKAEELLNNLAAVSSPATPIHEASAEEVQTHRALHDLFVLNQHLLNALGVGHTALDKVCSMAQEHGLAAKLTGGGGGGCAVLLIPPRFPGTKLEEAKQAFIQAGFDCWETTIGSKGVTLHYVL